MALKIFTVSGCKQSLRARQVQLLNHALAGIGVKEALQLGGRGLNSPFRLVDDILANFVRGEHLGAGGDGDRPFHRIVRVELYQARRRNRVRHLHTGKLQKFQIQLSRNGVEPVHRLIKHLPEQSGNRRARIVRRSLVAPLGRILSGVGGHLHHDVLKPSGVQNRCVHTAPPPSEPSVT
ncbi:hypothetical protein SDC9_176559 [bioreactor metagenome]|uniref:Uncharacterized protein n=1 Tax=bioreactor metagenome TaxID=1076179 RepID=A0A645GQD1_9ZZZZ